MLPPHLRIFESPPASAFTNTPPAEKARLPPQPKRSLAIVTSSERIRPQASVSDESVTHLSGTSLGSVFQSTSSVNRTGVSFIGKMYESPLEATTAEQAQLPGFKVLQPTSTYTVKGKGRDLSPTTTASSRSGWLPPHLRLNDDLAASVTAWASEIPAMEKLQEVSRGNSRITDQPGVPQRKAYGSSTMSYSSATSAGSDWTERAVEPTLGNAKGKARAMDHPALVPTPAKLRTGDAADWTRKTEAPLKMGKAFPCTYEKCRFGFESSKLLKKHKMDQHDYCKKCDMDFEDFQEHLDHKVGSPNHITCPVCSEDFKSSGGRDTHILAMHPNPQNLHCPGCGEKFIRAGSLIDHLEKNSCKSISIDQFERYRTVHAIKEAHLSMLSDDNVEDEHVPVLDDTVSLAETSIGGVDLNSEEDHLGPGSEEDAFRFPTLAPHVLPIPPTSSGGPMPQVLPIRAAPPKGLSYAEKVKASLDQAKVNLTSAALEASQTKMDSPPGQRKFPAWTTPEPGATALFPVNKDRYIDPSKPRDVQEIMTRMLVGQQRASPGLKFMNGLTVEAIDPSSPKFNPDGFMDPLGRWRCPYPDCGKVFSARVLFVAHLNSPAHKGSDHRCPECYRMFRSAAAITQHMEATGSKCMIRESRHYGKIVGLVSGGMITVDGEHEDGTVRYEAAEPTW